MALSSYKYHGSAEGNGFAGGVFSFYHIEIGSGRSGLAVPTAVPAPGDVACGEDFGAPAVEDGELVERERSADGNTEDVVVPIAIGSEGAGEQ